MSVAYDVTKWTHEHPYSVMYNDVGACKVLTGVIDFTRRLPIYSATAQADALVPGAQAGTLVTDTIRVVNIPAQAFVIGARVKTSTVNGGTCTVDVGDSADPNGYVSGGNIATALNTFSYNAAASPAALGIGKFYAADDYLLVTTNHTTAIAIVQFQIVFLDLTSNNVPLVQ